MDSTTDVYTIEKPGIYQINAQVEYTNLADQDTGSLRILRDGVIVVGPTSTVIAAATSEPFTVALNFIWKFDSQEYIEMQTSHSNVASRTVRYAYLGIHHVGR
jgi:hypothetical protein